MPAPATTDDLLALVRKSNLIDPERLEAFLADGPMPASPKQLAAQLVRAGLVTQFQSEQFLLGKWRGFTIGKYKVLERLGFGGNGTVYLCEHLMVQRRAAVKVLPSARAECPSALGRFYREARAAGVLDHPNLVKCHDIDQDGGLHFLVLDYVDGSSLQEIVARFGPMDVLRACHYISQAASGLEHAHQSGLVHRDIKPANIVLDRSGLVRVLDLGLARFFRDEKDLLTLQYDEKNVLGTADYVAPEQALCSHDADIRADIYSLGATFYFLLTGKPPFPEGKAAQKLIYHQIKQPTPVPTLRPAVPVKLAAVIEKMMAKDPAQRYQTPGDVVTALAPWTQEPVPPPPDAEMPRLCPAVRPDADGDPPSAPPRQPGVATPTPAPAQPHQRPAGVPRPRPPLRPVMPTPIMRGMPTGRAPTAPAAPAGNAPAPKAKKQRIAPPVHPTRKAASMPETRPEDEPAAAPPEAVAPPSPPRPGPPPLTWKRGFTLVALVALSALIGVGSRWLTDWLRGPPQEPPAQTQPEQKP
jgi:eukaryotic-like serine/threonine-protein kinase